MNLSLAYHTAEDDFTFMCQIALKTAKTAVFSGVHNGLEIEAEMSYNIKTKKLGNLVFERR